jgi:hypothetical protein
MPARSSLSIAEGLAWLYRETIRDPIVELGSLWALASCTCRFAGRGWWASAAGHRPFRRSMTGRQFSLYKALPCSNEVEAGTAHPAVRRGAAHPTTSHTRQPAVPEHKPE